MHITFNYFRWIFSAIMIASISLSGCYYRKVQLTKAEKELIPYRNKKSFSVFECNAIRDTVHFIQADRKYTPHFDHWWDKTLHNDTTSKREFGYSILARSNFPHNKYSDEHLHLIQEHIFFLKRYDEDSLRLGIKDLEPIYTLNKYTADTLVFRRPVDKPCHQCITEMLWTAERGIVQIEKNDGTLWKILNRED